MSISATEAPDTSLVGSGLAALVMLARFHNVAASPEQLAHELADSGKPFGRSEILLAAKQLGLKASLTRTNLDRLSQTPLPAIAADQAGGFFVTRAKAGMNARRMYSDPVDRP